jgi:4-diphosphocytidyl-2-C-methyl-D-erythritol kinase
VTAPGSVVERAAAKLNLRLAVGPLGADGYHPLESLMVELDGLHDDIDVAPADARAVECPGVPERENLAWRALDELERAVGRPLPVRVRITKRIPAQAGLGGGSSDAAAVLRAADRLFGLGLSADRLREVGARVGSDVPFFIAGAAAWVAGRGERVSPTRVAPFAAVIVRPPFGLPTGAVYRRFDHLAPPQPLPARGEAPPMPALATWVRNDLWPAALALAPGLAAPARALSAAGARRVLLCGSGSCLAGLAADDGEARRVAERLRGWAPVALVTPVAGARSGTA